MKQAIILAAGKSKRCHPLTLTRPKALLKVANCSIIEHNLNNLQGLVNEVIIVVGYKDELIRQKIGTKYKKLKIIYINQPEQKGSAHALQACEDYVKNNILLLNGDDFYSQQDLKNCTKHKFAILVNKVKDPSWFGVVESNEEVLIKIEEKPKAAKSNLVNTGLYVFDKSIFSVLSDLKASTRGEFELTDAVTDLAKKEKISIIQARQWLPNGYPWDLLNSNYTLLLSIKNDIQAKVQDGVTIKGKVILGKGSLIKSGTYIEGPVVVGKNTTIGPNSYVRGSTSIGDNCKVGQAVEIKNSIIMDGSKIPHLSYVGDSVIGENVNFGAGTIVANLRYDNSNIKSAVNGKLMDTQRRKLGTIIGDNVHTGINTSIYPGRKIWPGKSTLPGEIVKKDIM